MEGPPRRYALPMTLPESDDEIVLLHNPSCSKSRAAKSLLEARGIAYTERRYLDDPLTREELAELRRRLDRPVREWVRRGERAFSEAGLDAGAGDEALIDAIASAPILLERPIVVRGAQARVGRPPTDVLELLDE